MSIDSNKSRDIDSEGVAARVNDKDILQRDVELLVQLNNAYGSNMLYNDALSNIIMDELYYQAAVKRGLQVTHDTAREYASQTKQELEYAENKEEMEIILKTIMESLEMTEEEYWEWTIKKYEKFLSITKLREAFIDRNGVFNAQEFESYGRGLFEKAEVVVQP